MKKISVCIILLSGVLYGSSQSLEEIKIMIGLRQYDKAKAGLDKYMTDTKNAAKPETWYLKGFVYNALSQAPGKSIADINALNQESFLALKKYREMDPKAEFTTKEENTTIYNVYSSFFDVGIKNYNAKSYADSYSDFGKALEVHDYIYANDLAGPKGTKFSAHDTDLVWNMVILGNELKKTDEVLVFYKKIADADLGDEKYAEAYEAMVKLYKKENNKELFDKYLERARKHYPADPYWEAVGVEYATNGLEKEELFKKYDELTLAYPNSYMVFFNYGYDLIKFVNAGEAKPGDLAGYKKKIPDLFKKAISINSTIDANMLLTNFYYNSSFDIVDEATKIKGTKPEDVKKKADLIALSKTTLNQCIPYGEEAVKLFSGLKEYKSSDKVNYRQVLDILSTVYKQNGDDKRSQEYEKKKAEIK